MKTYKTAIVIVFISVIIKQNEAQALNLREAMFNQFSSIVGDLNVIRKRRESVDNIESTTKSSEAQNYTVIYDQPAECEPFEKQTNRKVRKKRELFFGVLLPINMPDRGGSRSIMFAMELAVKKVQAPEGILEGWNITMEHRDTQCSSVYGPLAAFELYTKQKPGFYFKDELKHIDEEVEKLELEGELRS